MTRPHRQQGSWFAAHKCSLWAHQEPFGSVADSCWAAMRCSQAGALWSGRQLLRCRQALIFMAGSEPAEQGCRHLLSCTMHAHHSHSSVEPSMSDCTRVISSSCCPEIVPGGYLRLTLLVPKRRTSWERELRVQQNQSRQLDSTATSTDASAMPTTSSVLRFGPRLTQLAV